MMAGKLITTSALAEWLDVTPAALRMQRMRDQAPGSLGFLVGSRLRYDVADVAAWIEDQKAKATPGEKAALVSPVPGETL